MKIKCLLLGLIALLFLNACNNEAKTSYEQLSQELNQVEFSQLSLNSIETLVNKIDNHLNKFPDFEQNSILIDFKNNAMIVVENKVYEELLNSLSQIENETYQNYESAIKSFNSAKQNLSEFISRAKNKQNIQDAENRIEKINEQLNSINLEQNDFFSAINSNNVNTIEEFLNKYPYSVMKNSLSEKIDEIYYSEFLGDFNSSPSSIYALNNSVNKAKSYLTKFRSIEAKTKINELIINLESQRRPILEAELQDGLQELIEKMEDAARTKAKNAHPTYNVEMCAARGSSPEVVGYSSTFERLYQVNMKGAFLGIDTREMMIAVSGRIKGDIQNGVSISITGSRVDSDRKY